MTSSLRRGLPRTLGGDPWPPLTNTHTIDDDDAAPVSQSSLRQGLPRVAGGAPWPPAHAAGGAQSDTTVPVVSAEPSVATEAVVATAEAPLVADVAPSVVSGNVRRGLPRVKDGDPWPPVTAPVEKSAPAAQSAPVAKSVPDAKPVQEPLPPATPVVPEVKKTQTTPAVAESARPAVAASSSSMPQPAQPKASVKKAEPKKSKPQKSEPKKYGPYTLWQWIGGIATVIVALEIVALLVVLGARGLMQLDAVQDFVRTYPGHSELPESAPIGIPAWMGWQHFLNMFLMVLIIRSGLQVRRETKPAAYWSPKGSTKKVSLTIWFHQALDVLWLVNGLIFVILLFATGQWMKIVPTSWDVFPNAISAGLQYATLNWPVENGWVNYNGLQLLAYFVTVFIAAPLAALTGFRMSTLWPEKNKTLNRIYPAEIARKIHFPVMIYFVAFIVVHVALVFATGALRNLNHMYAARGSVDPNAYAGDWTGFWILVASLVVVAGAWIAARPMVLAPIAKIFGKVSSR